MADSLDVHILTLPIGAFTGATELPMVYLPADGGAITLLSAHLFGPSAGTVVGGKLVVMSAAGTPALEGTVANFAGTVVTAAGVPGSATIVAGTAVQGGRWLGFDQTSGTVAAGSFVAISYVMGR